MQRAAAMLLPREIPLVLMALATASALATRPAWAADSLPATAQSECQAAIHTARYDTPTDRYPHGALGDPYEWAAMTLGLQRACPSDASDITLDLPDDLVFEDVRPLLADLDGDGSPEVLTVESHRDKGARLTVWGLVRNDPPQIARIASTPFIGTTNRWMAQLGAADLDGDGIAEIAYVDRPHLAKILRIWRLADGRLTEIAALPGVTNHRFGEPEISGGIRTCGNRPEIVLATGNWSDLLAVTLKDGRLSARMIDAATDPAAFARALACR